MRPAVRAVVCVPFNGSEVTVNSLKCFSCWVLAGALSAGISAACASELTLPQALGLALTRSPVLEARGYALQGAEAELKVRELSPPWAVSGEIENVAGSGSLRGLDSAETTVRLGRVIELGGKREARIASGLVEIERQELKAEVARVDVASAVRRRYIDMMERQARLRIAEANVGLLEETRSLVARWVQAGRSSDAELAQAGIAAGRAALARDDAGHELATARLALASLWGELDPDFAVDDAALMSLPAVPGFAELAGRLPASLDQRDLALDAERVAAERRAAVAGGRPDLNLSLGVRRLENIDEQALVLGASLPLGTQRRSALSAAGLDAQLAELRARRNATGLDAHQQLYGLYEELQHARHVVEAHRNDLIGQAGSAASATRRGYESGRLNFYTLAQAEQLLTELRLAELAAAARYHRLLVDIERLTALPGEITP